MSRRHEAVPGGGRASRRAPGAASALGFLTVLGGAAPPTPRALPWFGPVGLLVGGLVGAGWWGAAQLVPALVAAGLALVVDLALTGFLHVDGLADTADGLLPPLERTRRLAVMRQPDVGAFGTAAVVVVLLLRAAALAALVADAGAGTVMLVAGLWAVARAALAVALVSVPPARPGGLAALFAGPAGKGPTDSGPTSTGLAGSGRSGWSPGRAVRAVRAGGMGLLLGAGALLVGWGGPGLVAGAAGLAAGAAVVALARRRLGGCTGDVLGATGMVIETAGLVVATVWV